MSSPGQISMAMPRPGPALKVILALIAGIGIAQAIVVHWLGAGFVREWLVVDTGAVLDGELWRLLTAGFLTSPDSLSHLLFTLAGLYFLSPDLERRWGAKRFVAFLVTAVVAGFVLDVALDAFTPLRVRGPFFGAGAAILATAVAWGRENASATVRLFFFIPVTGRQLSWITVGLTALSLVYPVNVPEGIPALFVGILCGFALTGNPSPARALVLRVKLALLRRRVIDAARPVPTRTNPRSPRTGGPPLRVVPGGLEEELKKRKPPKDKRYLN
jgi:membrane associated rhomboid family serine protease